MLREYERVWHRVINKSALTFWTLPRFTNSGLRDRKKERHETMNTGTWKYRSTQEKKRETTAVIFSQEETSPCFEWSLPISMHRVGVEKHQMNIIHRRSQRKRSRLRYPDRGERPWRPRADCAQYRTVRLESQRSLWSKAPPLTRCTQGKVELPVRAFTIKPLISEAFV